MNNITSGRLPSSHIKLMNSAEARLRSDDQSISSDSQMREALDSARLTMQRGEPADLSYSLRSGEQRLRLAHMDLEYARRVAGAQSDQAEYTEGEVSRLAGKLAMLQVWNARHILRHQN